MKKKRLLLTLFILLSSCKTNNLIEIDYQDIFSIREEKYFIYFYSSSCQACLDGLNIIQKRYDNKKQRGFLLKTDNLNIDYSTDIKSNINVNSIEEFHLFTLPYLIIIENQVIEKEFVGIREIQKENYNIFFE